MAPIITEGFIGVCCKSVQKVCNHLKQSLEKGRREGTKRITRYDGKVLPDYSKFPHNAQICCGLANPMWNAPLWVVKKWIRLNMEQWMDPAKSGKAIVLSPLDLQDESGAYSNFM